MAAPNGDSGPDDTERDGASAAQAGVSHLIEQTHAALEAWRVRMNDAGSGRGATITARMATARAASELRRLVVGDEAGEGAGYARRAAAAVNRAAREIERNRYSLQAMHAELERLEAVFLRLTGAEAQSPEAAGDGASGATASGDAGGGTDD
jgi:hypothetical protein